MIIMKWIRRKNSNCRICGDIDEKINHILSECRKLAQKEYKTWHDWVGKVGIMQKKLIVTIGTSGTYTTRICPEEWDTQTSRHFLDPLISARCPDLVILNKKRWELVEEWTLLFRQTTEWK